MTTPLPCPFCGETPEVLTPRGYWGFAVRCVNDDCAVRPHTKLGDPTLLEAVFAWNTRKGEVTE